MRNKNTARALLVSLHVLLMLLFTPFANVETGSGEVTLAGWTTL